MKAEIFVDPPASLSKIESQELFEFFSSAFQADQVGFENDLQEKERILRVRNDSELVAFSTLTTYRPEAGVRLVFSGDTFVGSQARIGHRLPALWARYVYQDMPRLKGVRDYWLLLCSGYRTYRILPTFFSNFAPSLTREPELLALRDRWAADLFSERFVEGIVRPQWATPLKDPTPPARLAKDPHVQFFLSQNPGYRQGDELVCLAPLCEENLTLAGKRLALSP